MEADQASPLKCILSRKSSSSSFRLRSPSLNSLRLRRIFDVFDKNGDGMITAQEISQAINLLGLEDLNNSELDSTINSFLQKGNDGLRFEDFEALHQSLYDAYFSCEESNLKETENQEVEKGSLAMTQEESDLTEAFKVFDEDGDGFISAKELQVVLGKLGFPESKEIDRVQMMITSVDRNRDGRVDFFEFKNMMQNFLVPT